MPDFRVVLIIAKKSRFIGITTQTIRLIKKEQKFKNFTSNECIKFVTN